MVQLLAFRRPDLVAGLVLVDPAHEQMTAALPPLLRSALRLARAGRRNELRGAGAAATAAVAAVILDVVAQIRASDR